MMFARSALTIALALSLSHPAFAAENTTDKTNKLVNSESVSINPSLNPMAKNKAAKVAQPQSNAQVSAISDPYNSDQSTVNSANPYANTTEQDLNPKMLSQMGDINNPSDDQDTSQPVSSQTEQDLKNAQDMVNKMPENPSAGTESGSKAKQDWSLESLNNATWASDLGKGQFTEYAKAQVLLNRYHASPGVIDGTSGKNMLKAISAFQVMNGLPATGMLDAQTWEKLSAGQNNDVFQSYTLTQEDIDGPYAKSIPHDYAEQAKMKALSFTSITEMLGERFHMDENFLKKLNPNADFSKAGTALVVTNPREDLSDPVALIIAHKGAKQLYAFDANNKMVATFPATIGSTDTPSPKGTYQVKAIAPNPWYGYSPKNFLQGNNNKPLSLPPGPNNPVGNMWIALSKPSFGIHGTPNPSLISKTASHGCIRLTNWDANALSKRVTKGVTVRFLE